jgi:hypothetical protein
MKISEDVEWQIFQRETRLWWYRRVTRRDKGKPVGDIME